MCLPSLSATHPSNKSNANDFSNFKFTLRWLVTSPYPESKRSPYHVIESFGIPWCQSQSYTLKRSCIGCLRHKARSGVEDLYVLQSTARSQVRRWAHRVKSNFETVDRWYLQYLRYLRSRLVSEIWEWSLVVPSQPPRAARVTCKNMLVAQHTYSVHSRTISTSHDSATAVGKVADLCCVAACREGPLIHPGSIRSTKRKPAHYGLRRYLLTSAMR